MLVGAVAVLVLPGFLDVVLGLAECKAVVSGALLLTWAVAPLFLLYFSLKVRRLEGQHVALVRAVAVMERRLRKRFKEGAAIATSDPDH